MKKLIALLISTLMLLMPVIGCAETAGGYGYLSIANPSLSATIEGETTELDLAGIELKFAAENKDDVTSLLISLLANNTPAITGHASFDETGLYAALEGMQTGVTVPMETIEMLLEMLMSELEGMPAELTFSSSVIGGADGPTEIIIDSELGELEGFFSDEAMATFMTAADAFASSMTMTAPVEDTVFENNSDVPAQRVDYSVDNASFAALMKAFGELLMSNEEFAAGYKQAIEEEGAEYEPLGDVLSEAITVYDVSFNGSAYMTESGSIYADNYINYTDDYGDACSMNVYVSISSDAEGNYIYASLYPTEETDDYLEFFLASMYSTEVEGAEDIYCDLSVYAGNEVVNSIVLTSFPYYDDAGVVNNVIDLTLNGEDESIVTMGFNWYAEESIYGGAFYLSATEYAGANTITSELTLSYDGQVSADGLSHTGVFEAEFYADDNNYAYVSTDVAFGIDVSGESIAYDFSGYKMLDVTTATEDDIIALGEEAGTALMMGLFTIVGQVPALMSMMN